MKGGVSAVDADLTKLLDDPRLQAEFDIHSPSPAVTVVHSKAQLLQMRAQELSNRLDSLTSDLQQRMDEQREGMIEELEGVEDWMRVAYSVVLLEPNRLLYPSGVIDVMSLRARSVDSSSVVSEEEWLGSSGRGSDVSGHGSDVGMGEEVSSRGEAEEAGEEGGVEEREWSEAQEYDVEFKMSLDPEEVDEEAGGGGGEGVNDDPAAVVENGEEGVIGSGSDPSVTGTVTSGEGSSEVTQSEDTSE